MSGCIEIRELDLDAPELLPDALTAIDDLMMFFRQKGTDIVRIREFMGVDASEIIPEMKDMLKSRGYVFVNGFYAKGVFSDWTVTKDEALRLMLSRQHIDRVSRFDTLREFISNRPYIRSDQEMVCRVKLPSSLKKYRDNGTLLKGSLLPEYVGYATMSNMAVIKAAKQAPLGSSEAEVVKVIRERGPLSKKEVQFRSPLSYEETSTVLTALSARTVVVQDEDGYYKYVPDNGMSRDEGLIEVAKWHFADYLMMSAEDLSEYLGLRMAETRRVLARMEFEGILVKGFFIEGDSTLYWMRPADVGSEIPAFNADFVINSQDNLAHFLRERIKDFSGSMRSAVFSGTEVIGSFKGKVTPSEVKIEDFKGSDKALDVLSAAARAYGLSVAPRTKVVEDDMDWESSDFYDRTNPGL